MYNKIYILINDISLGNGTERATINLANNLSKNKYEVTIMTLKKLNQSTFFDINNDIKIVNFNIKLSNNFFLRMFNYLYLLSTLRFYKFQKESVLIGTGHQLNFCIAISSLFSNIKVIACEHLSFGSIPIYSKILRLSLYKLFDKVIVLTENDKKYYLNKGLNNVEVIPNEKTFNNVPPSSLLTNNILSIGRFELQKGYDILIPGISKLLKKYNNWKLIIVGEGSMKSDLEKLIDHNDIKENIILCSPTKNIENYYLDASIYVMSSRYEGLPMVLIEAKSFGIPIVSFDCPFGPSEVVKKDDGILVENGNVDKLINSLEELMINEQKRIELGKNALTNSNVYHSDSIFTKWEKVFSNL